MLKMWRTAPLVACVTACAGAEVTSHPDVAYDVRRGAATTMDVYVPDDGAIGRPAVMFVHGGGWRLLSKEVHSDHAQRLAEMGYVTASINYRLVPEGVYGDLVKDCFCALAFLRGRADDYGLDPDRIAVIGYSAGGHLVSLLGVADGVEAFAPDCGEGPARAPNAVVSGAGPTDLADLPEVDAVVEFVGGTQDEVPERYVEISPIHHVDADAPPYLFIHGDADLFVGLSHSERMRDALRDAGVPAQLLTLEGGGHIVNPGSSLGHADVVVSALDTPEAWMAATDFLARTVGAP